MKEGSDGTNKLWTLQSSEPGDHCILSKLWNLAGEEHVVFSVPVGG